MLEKRTNQILKNKTKSVIALFLMLAIAFPLATLPASFAWDNPTNAAVAAGMKWDFPGAADVNASASRLILWERYHDKIPTVVYSVISPNPTGVGQEVTMLLFNPVAPPASLAENDIRWQYTVVITDPDGVDTALPASGTFISDATGTAYTSFTPTKVGNYSVTVKFHECFYRWYIRESNNVYDERTYYGTTFLESTNTKTLVVQTEPVTPTAITHYPLPTEYWTRPIEGENTAWAQVSSNWYNNAHDLNYQSFGNRYQPDGVAPNSGHILWTKPLEDGGVVGGTSFFVPDGEVFNVGSPPYSPRFQTQIIMYGRLYYEQPSLVAGTGGGWMCVDLRTGEKIWGPTVFPIWSKFRLLLRLGHYEPTRSSKRRLLVCSIWNYLVFD